jgi:O-antigen ligase
MRVTVFGVYFATRYSLGEQMKLLAWAFSISVLLCLLFGLVLKSYGVVGMGYIDNMEDVVHVGAWRGIYVHKTFLGTIMSTSALIFLFNLVKRQYNLIMLAGLVLSVYVLFCSTTKAALGIFLITFILTQVYRAFRWKNNILLPLLACVLLCTGIIITIITSNAESILLSLGRDITISGRTDIWPLVIEKIWNRPWLGYGYLTFWDGGWESEVADIWRQLEWGFEPPHAHNGFLEICLSSGFIGLGVYVLSFIHNVFKAFSLLKVLNQVASLVPITFLTTVILINSTESLLIRGDIYWVLYVSVTISLHNKYSTHLLDSYLPKASVFDKNIVIWRQNA